MDQRRIQLKTIPKNTEKEIDLITLDDDDDNQNEDNDMDEENDEEEEEEDNDEDSHDDDNDIQIIEVIQRSKQNQDDVIAINNRIEAQKREAETSFCNEAKAHINEEPPVKVKRLETDSPAKRRKSSEKVVQKEETVDELLDKYISVCKTRMKESEEKKNELIGKLSKVVLQLKNERPNFVASKQFISLMKMTTDDIKNEIQDELVFRHHKDLYLELNRLRKEKKNPREKKECEEKVSKSKLNARIKKLTKSMKQLQHEIAKAESAELDFDAMNGKSAFTHVEKLIKKHLQVWEKREELLKRSTKSGREMVKPFRYNGTTFNDINSAVEKEVNKFIKRIESWNRKGYMDETLTICEIHKIVTDVIKEKGLSVGNVDTVVQQVFVDVRTELIRRRNYEVEDDMNTFSTLDDLLPETSANPKRNPLLEKELAINKSSFERKLDELYKKYAEKDLDKNGELNGKFGEKSEWEQTLTDEGDFESLDVHGDDLYKDSDNSEDEDADEETQSQEDGEEDNIDDESQ